MLYLDIPSTADLTALAGHRGDMSVSIFLPTTPVTRETEADRILLKNLAREGLEQLAHADKRRVAALAEELDDLIDDDEFWRFQARGLAIYVTPDNLRTFRVPNALEPLVMVSDRFHLKPLLRSITFCNACYVLALAEGSVRLVEVSADLPAVEVKLTGMPDDAASAVGKASIAGRSYSGRLGGSEGKTVRLRQYARQVDAALRGRLSGSDIPLVLAAVDSLGAIYRSVNSYPHLLATGLDGSPERKSEAELANAARALLDDVYRGRIIAWRTLFDQRSNEGRASADIVQVARAATFGAVHSLLVDMDRVVHGTVAESDGAVTLAASPGAQSYGVVDEIARRVLASGGQVLGVRQADIPGGGPLAAILRYPA